MLQKGDIPADLTPWKVKEGYDYGNQTDWTFYDSANIEVDAVVNLHTDKLNEPVYFYLTKNGSEIQGSRVEFTPTVTHEPQAVIPTMKARVQMVM